MPIRPTVTVKTIFDHIPRFRYAMDDAVQKGVDATAYAVQGSAQRIARYRTGTMRRSIHVITPTSSGYGRAMQAAISADRADQLIPEAPTPRKHSAIVGVAVLYGKFVEFGTRFMAAHPYLIPALEIQAKYLPVRIREFASRFR